MTPTTSTTPTHLSNEFLNTLKFETFNEECLIKAKEEAAQYISEIDRNETPRWISFVGKSGTGKTFIAKQIYKFILERIAESSKFENKRNIFILDCYATTADKLAEIWRTQKSGYIREFDKADLLFIDDIGTTADKSGFITDAMYSLLSRRMGKWTILTSNLDYKGITEQFDERLADRMIRDGNKVVKMNCKSFSLRK